MRTFTRTVVLCASAAALSATAPQLAQAQAQTQTLKARATATEQGNNVVFKGLTRADIDDVRTSVNRSTQAAVNALSTGTVAKQKKDCKRIDLTNKLICLEITIEDIPE